MAEVRPEAEPRGRSALERWLLACASAVVYYTLARLGLEFALPAAGFALAATVLWGPAAAAGVFAGALLAFERPLPAGPASFLAAAAISALGAAAQALAGAALLRRDGSAADPPRRTADAARFCLLAAPIALISPMFEALALAAGGTPAGAGWPRTVLTWWIGNAAGLLLASPLVLAWARPPRDAFLGPRAATSAAAALAVPVLWLAAKGELFALAADPQASLMIASAALSALSILLLLARARLEERGAAAGKDLAAAEREEASGKLFDNLPIGVLLMRLEEPENAASLRIVGINRAGRAISGAGDAPVEGTLLRDFAPEALEAPIAGAWLEVLRTGGSVVIRDFLSPGRVPGAYFNLSVFALGKSEVGIAFENISEQKKKEKMLQDNAQLLLLMIESVREYAIFRLGRTGLVESWSRGAELIYGYLSDEMLGVPYARLFPPDSTPDAQLAAAEREGRMKTESWCLRKDGRRFWADIVLTALRDEAGAFLGCAAVVRDATQRRASAQGLERRAAELSRSNIELSQFAYVASHDLSAPLHKVKAFADRLKSKLEGRLDEEGQDYFRRMLRAVEGMQRLIDALLELARVTTRGGAPEVVDLGALARDVVEGLDHAMAGARTRVEIGPLPKINADPLQMRQLLQNLLSNALKFHKPGAAPRVRVHGKATGDGRCELVVSDNGIGFEMKDAERIFQPFARLQGPQEYEGSGMGLAICRRIAARHGGTIAATGRPGRGSEFRVTLPISQEGRMECPEPEKASL